jgi:hypothetical protein
MRDGKLIPHHLTIPVSRPGYPSGYPASNNVTIMKEGSYSVGDLAHILKRSHPSIGKSIRRLRAQGKVEFDKGGFRLKQ